MASGGPKVLCVGRNAVDLIIDVDIERLRPDSKQQSGPVTTLVGGQCINAAGTIAGLGLHVAYAGVIGDDDGGRIVQAFLESRGIDASPATVAPGTPNAVSYIMVDGGTGERTIIESAPVPFPQLGEVAIPEGCAYVYFDGHEFPASLTLAQQAAAEGIPTLCDAELVNANTRALIAAVHTAILPMPAAIEIAGTTDLDAILRAIVEMGPKRAVVTMGERGAVGLDEHGGRHDEPAMPCKAVDTTGAGDAFHAGFLAADLAGLTFADALGFATRVASANCEVKGPSLSPDALKPLAALLQVPA